MAKAVDLLEQPSRLYPTIKHSLCFSSSVEVTFVSQDRHSLLLINQLWQLIQDNVTLWIPFLRHALDNSRLDELDASPEDFFTKLIPTNLHHQPLNRWINAIKLLATALTPSLHVLSPSRTTNDVRSACKALAHAVALFELVLYAPGGSRGGLPFDAQMAFETETVAVIISDDLIIVPRLSKSFRDFLSGVDCDPTFERAARLRLTEDSEPSELGDGSVDMYEVLNPTFDVCESLLFLSTRAERKLFLAHLLNLIIFESGIDGSVLQRPNLNIPATDIGRAGGALNLTTLRYVASSCPLAGLAPSVPRFTIKPITNKSETEMCATIIGDAPLLPLQLAKLSVAFHHLAKSLEGSNAAINNTVSINYKLSDTTLKAQKRMGEAVAAIPEGMNFTHEGVSTYLQRFRAWSETVLFGSAGAIITRRAIKEREKLHRLSQLDISNALTNRSQAAALADVGQSANQRTDRSKGDDGLGLPARRRARSGGRARPGCRITEGSSQTNRKEAQKENIAQTKRLDKVAQKIALGDQEVLDEVLPESLRIGLHTVHGNKIFCLGRFPQLPVLSASFAVFLESVAVSLESADTVVAPSRLLTLLLGGVDIFVISAYLFDEYRDLIALGRKERCRTSVDPSKDMNALELYTRLYRLLPQERCRSAHWLINIGRAHKYFSKVLAGRTAAGWLSDLPTTHGLTTPLNDPFKTEGGSVKELPFWEITPSRGLFLMASPSAYTMHDFVNVKTMLENGGGKESHTDKRPSSAPSTVPDTPPARHGHHLALCNTSAQLASGDHGSGGGDECPWALGSNTFLSFASREALGRIVRSPTRNILLTGPVGRALLRPLLDSVRRREPSAPKMVRIVVILPRGLVEDDGQEMVDWNICTVVRSYVQQDLNPLYALQQEYGPNILQVETVSHTWLEECFLQGEGVDYRAYVVTDDEEGVGYYRYAVGDQETKRRLSEASYQQTDGARIKVRRTVPS